jgi:hypothetical protein
MVVWALGLSLASDEGIWTARTWLLAFVGAILTTSVRVWSEARMRRQSA